MIVIQLYQFRYCFFFSGKIDNWLFVIFSRAYIKALNIGPFYCPEIVPLAEAVLNCASAIQVSWSLESGFANSSWRKGLSTISAQGWGLKGLFTSLEGASRPWGRGSELAPAAWWGWPISRTRPSRWSRTSWEFKGTIQLYSMKLISSLKVQGETHQYWNSRLAGRVHVNCG